ncbi:acyltransferase [Desulfonatronum thioautotrophicum]|uniref:acyltransferase n=1 Tax=Desulfonatronum thioautotrophicum TaxID=617001 RepID=UPI0005EB9969|nr:acyltransferase [Desulfonatronum thioautotrophicum]
MLRNLCKRCGNGVSLVLAYPCAVLCWLERRLHPVGEELFLFWGQFFALVPGLPGVYLRRAFYRLTLSSCSAACYLGYGTYFTHRTAHVESGVYVGSYTLIGCAWLHTGCLIGSRASVLSSGQLHSLDEHGHWGPADRSQSRMTHIGEYSWLGEGAIVMADIGSGAMVAAGAVVSASVPDHVLVAGNPARFVRRLDVSPPPPPETHCSTDRAVSRDQTGAAT